MPAAIPYEIRKRAVEMIENESYSYEDVTEILKLSRKSIERWKKLKNLTGDVKPKKRSKGQRNKIKDLDEFKKFIDQNPNKTLKEYAEKWGDVSHMTIQRALKRINYTYKKKAFCIKKDLRKKEKLT